MSESAKCSGLDLLGLEARHRQGSAKWSRCAGLGLGYSWAVSGHQTTVVGRPPPPLGRGTTRVSLKDSQTGGIGALVRRRRGRRTTGPTVIPLFENCRCFLGRQMAAVLSKIVEKACPFGGRVGQRWRRCGRTLTLTQWRRRITHLLTTSRPLTMTASLGPDRHGGPGDPGRHRQVQDREQTTSHVAADLGSRSPQLSADRDTARISAQSANEEDYLRPSTGSTATTEARRPPRQNAV